MQVLERVVAEHGKPRAIRMDNGPEFVSKDVVCRFSKIRTALDISEAMVFV